MSWPDGAGKCQPTPQTLALMDKKNAEARDAVIEECAGVCDSIAHAAEIRGNTLPPQSDAQSAAYDKSESAARCAKAIRALSVSRPDGESPK